MYIKSYVSMKRTLYVFFLFLLGAFSVQAQQDSTEVEVEEKVEIVRKPLNIQGYVGGIYEQSPVSSHYTNSLGVQTALILKKHWQLGCYAVNYSKDHYRKQLIFPNSFQMNYKHGGFLLGYRTYMNKPYEITIESKVGFGEVKWKRVESERTFLADRFNMFHIQAGVDYMLTRFMALHAFSGYRWMNGLNITGLNSDDFKGFYWGFMFKIGMFR